MNILFYQPYNQAVPYIESVVELFAMEGHQTFFLSHAEEGETHENLRRYGCKTFTRPLKRKSFIQYYRTRISNLAKFCKENKINIAYSHFQEANLISVMAQFFCRTSFVITRHHTDCAFVDNNWKEKLGDKIINRLSKVYIATSRMVLRQIVDVEKCDPKKVRLINYGYNFGALPRLNQKNIDEIKRAYSAKVLLVKAARYIPEKRHAELIDTMQKLVEAGYDIKLLLLGRGPLEEATKLQIERLNLTERVYQLGFQKNITDYFAAADLVVHFSISEASNSAIKEAACTDTPVAVCECVGDFSDYILSTQSGFLLNRDNPSVDFMKVMEQIFENRYDLTAMGKQLHADVVSRFDIKNVIEDYRELNQMIGNGITK